MSIAQQPLRGRVVVCTGASRGAGKGVALALGAAGATVYCTGRTSRVAGGRPDSLPGTVEDTADEVSRLGGVGVPVVVDHTRDDAVVALFARVAAEQGGRLDGLVNSAWGGNELELSSSPFWEQSLKHWDGMFTAGVRAAAVAARFALPLMLPHRTGTIINVTFCDEARYTQNFWYDMAKASLNRMAHSLALELEHYQVAALALSPGWMRTERVLAAFGATEGSWRSVPGLAQTESPLYLGRAVAALLGDPAGALQLSGQILYVADLARDYGFTDVDGRRPERFLLSPYAAPRPAGTGGDGS